MRHHWNREAFAVVYDRAGRQLHEAVVSLTREVVVRCDPVPRARPSYLLEEVFAVPEAVMADPRWRTAMRRRGITDLSLTHIDPWPGAWLSETDPGDRRVCRALTWVRPPVENGHPYARPVEGLMAVVDLDRMEVVDVYDHGVVRIPEFQGEYVPELITEASESNRPRFAGVRDDVQPIHITQPDGPSWRVEGHRVTWQKWRLLVGWTAREGVVLFDIRYDDRGELRPVLYRASVSEMVVPYGDPAPTHVHKLAFDEGEAGLGLLVTPLTLGCDCLGEIHYFDGLGVDQDGNPLVLPNAICMHEEDVGIAWKHFDYQRETTEVRRMRRLVISSIINLGNYEYGFFWYLYQDGSIEFEVKLTGVLSTGAYRLGEKPRHGTAVAPGVYAPNHQHFFCVRLDTDIDGQANTVVEVNSEAVPLGPENPYGTAWVARETPLLVEHAAQRTVNPVSARFWRIMNPGRLNEMGDPVSYRLHPGANVGPFMHDDSDASSRTVRHQTPVGDPVRAQRAVRRGRLPVAEPGAGWLAAVDTRRPQHRKHRRGGVVRGRGPPRAPGRGVAGHVGDQGRFPTGAGRVLRRQPGPRPSAPQSQRPRARVAIAPPRIGRPVDVDDCRCPLSNAR